MISCPDFLAWMGAAYVDFFASVSALLLKNFCACLTGTRPGFYVSAANDDGAVVLSRLSIEAFCRKIRVSA